MELNLLSENVRLKFRKTTESYSEKGSPMKRSVYQNKAKRMWVLKKFGLENIGCSEKTFSSVKFAFNSFAFAI